MALVLVHPGTEHVQQQPPTLTHSSLMLDRCSTTKKTRTDSIYSGPDVVLNQYQDLLYL